MIKHWLPAVLLCFIAAPASSQTLFSFGPHKVDAGEFLKAFNRNNQQTGEARSQAMKEYLDLYINSRLKIQQAYDLHLDTSIQIRAEAENLRNQIVDNYMSDPEAITRLSKEAFQRSLKDIHAAHLFIAFSHNGQADTANARQKLAEAERRLAQGEDFMTVAQQLSDDPAAAENRGDLDYVTVFTLPYELETLLYNTAPGHYSNVFTSKAGYHIVKNLGERTAAGKMKIQQILLAFPPETDAVTESRIARLADSLYERINTGDDFGKLAAAFSNDPVSAQQGGITPEISVGEYDPVFEKTVWALPADGSVSKPFKTSHGYHIVKRLNHIPVVTDPASKENNQRLESLVKADDRWKTAKDFIYVQVRKRPGIQHRALTAPVLWAATDSLLAGQAVKNIDRETALFSIGQSVYRVSDWLQHVQMYRYIPGGATIRPYTSLMEEFTNNSMYQYYRDHLEEYNEEFRNQMAEFHDGNLFFEIMQQEVWNKAQTDTAGQLALYQKNKSNYTWKPSADAIVFFSSDQATATTLADELKKNPRAWRALAEKFSEKVVADSARYEWTQLPGPGKEIPKAGTVTALNVNETDNTASFACIIKVYSEPGIRSFEEARGLVMSDYQQQLETAWVKKLRKKYPVKVDNRVFNMISK